ncbi:MAG: hypothetical protein LAT51_13345 [Flavobacteriaceae bacterium]|nr:hypothetical protein [Flavobacteriaceae bacterium]
MKKFAHSVSNLILVLSFTFFGLAIFQTQFFDDVLVDASHCWICDAHGCTNAGSAHTGVTMCEDVENSNPPCSFDGELCDGAGTPPGEDPI